MSKRLKEENDALQQENKSLRAKLAQLEAQLATTNNTTQQTGNVTTPIPGLETSLVGKRASRSCTNTGKRAREGPELCTGKSIKRPRRTSDTVEELMQAHSTTPSSPCDESSRGALTPDPLADLDLATMDVDPSPLDKRSTHQDNQQHPEFRSCGMCSNPSNCLCQEYGLPPFNPPPASHGGADGPLTAKAALLDAAANASAQAVSFPSVIGNPLPAALAVPLPKRPRKNGKQSAFLAAFAKSSTATNTSMSTSTSNVVMTTEGATPKRVGCSGDPGNCSACADSAFGKAFCNALRNSVCTLNPCPTCSAPSHNHNNNPFQSDSQTKPQPTTIPTSINPSNLSCCGDPDKCGGSSCSTVKTPPLDVHGLPPDPMVIVEAARREKSQAMMHCVTCPSSIPVLPLHPHSHMHVHGQGQGQEEGGEVEDKVEVEDGDELPTEEAWRRIEAHPKAHLALEDRSRLHQLAEIMLGGARSLVSSRAGSVPAAAGASGSGSGQAKIQVEYEGVCGSGSGENGGEESRPRLVPEDELLRCQRQRRRITTLPKRSVSEGWNWLDHFDREFGRG